MVFSLLGTAYADTQAEPVAIQQIIQNDEKTNSFVDFIIDTMNSIFGLVYDLQDNPKLNQWGNQVIQDSAQRTQDQLDSQLGITHDIYKIKAESDKILNP
jgi:hypothetical protein